jgi:hypothetical protein
MGERAPLSHIPFTPLKIPVSLNFQENTTIMAMLKIKLTYLWAGRGRVGHKMPPRLLTVFHWVVQEVEV